MTVLARRTSSGLLKLSDHDSREVNAFSRYLREVGGRPGEQAPGWLWRERPGWVPYILGHFLCSGVWGPHDRSLHPPEGYGHVPLTAWTFPG